MMSVKKLDLYIVKKFLLTFFFILGVIMLIAIIFDISEKMDDFLRSRATVLQIILKYYVNFVLFYGNTFSPLIIFIAVIFFTAQMANRTEIIAILSSGVSFRRLLLPYFIAATLLAGLSFYLNNYMLPIANRERQAFEDEFMRSGHFNFDRNIHMQISPGVFIYFDSYTPERNTGYKFSMERWDKNELRFKLLADFARYDTSKGSWEISNFFIREINGIHETVRKGNNMDTIIPLHPKEFVMRLENTETMTTKELNEFIEEQMLKGSDLIPYYEIDKHQRTSLPFATYILTLIGVSMSSRKVRGGIGANIAIGLLICVSYILAMKVTSVYATNAGLDPLIAVWIPNVLFGALSVLLVNRAPK